MEEEEEEEAEEEEEEEEGMKISYFYCINKRLLRLRLLPFIEK